MESLGKSVSHAADPSTSSGEDKGLRACVCGGGAASTRRQAFCQQDTHPAQKGKF